MSLNRDTIVANSKLVSPIGINLTNESTRTIAPSPGAIAYDSGTNLLYYGDTVDWLVVTGVTGPTGAPITVGPYSASGNANGASITGNVLTLNPATNTTPGGINTSAQEWTGIKTFDLGIVVTPVVTAGLNNVINNFAVKSYTGGEAVNFTGAITVTQNCAFMWFEGVVSAAIGNATNGSSPGGLITMIPNGHASFAAEFTPGTAPGRYGTIRVVQNGVVSLGAFLMSNAGIMTVGTGVSSTGVLTPFTANAGVTGILDYTALYNTY